MGAAIARDAPPALQTIVSALLRTKIELAIAGLDASGKSTLAACLRDPMLAAAGESTKPTIGLVVTRARQRGIDVMLWDLGGHRRFRDDWSKHIRGCGAFIFVVDASDSERFGEARQALHALLEDPIIGRLPLLVLANKIDLLAPADRACEEVRGWASLAHELSLMDADSSGFADHSCQGGGHRNRNRSRRRSLGEDSVDREAYYDGDLGVGGGGGVGSGGRWSVLGVSATRAVNLDKVLRWLVLQAHGVGDDTSAESNQVADGHEGGVGRRATRLWQSLRGSKIGRRSARWRGFSLLSDATRSLLVEGS